jgi:(1->4)-alpha-D-glucan 1-alpha-D-glucosylmutase
VLAEMPDAFAEAVRRWSTHNAKFRSGDQVDTGTEWFLYQTLVGAWPISKERLREYMLKAMREAKVRTSWVANNAEYENALNGYIDAILGDAEFVGELQNFVGEVTAAGRVNSLAQTLMKYTAPGVPDLYQGGELWDLSLVDPDNRRPVDYGRRAGLLKELQSLTVEQVLERGDEGLPKLWVVHQGLQLRKEHPDWFGVGAEYASLGVDGDELERVIAYRRGAWVVTVVPRWSHAAKAWGETMVEVPEGRWRNRLTGAEVGGGRVLVDELLKAFPVALLTREG